MTLSYEEMDELSAALEHYATALVPLLSDSPALLTRVLRCLHVISERNDTSPTTCELVHQVRPSSCGIVVSSHVMPCLTESDRVAESDQASEPAGAGARERGRGRPRAEQRLARGERARAVALRRGARRAPRATLLFPSIARAGRGRSRAAASAVAVGVCVARRWNRRVVRARRGRGCVTQL